MAQLRHDPLHSRYMPASRTTPVLVQQQPTLEQACKDLAQHSELALDTEFVRTNTYYPKLGLIQLSTGEFTVCVDPLAGLDLNPLWEVLFDPGRLMIVHAAKQDLEVLLLTAEGIPRSLIDTQIEAGLLGHAAQVGYATLAKTLLDVGISKSQTRTDWSKRPLSEAQLHYAAEDVEHLSTMHQRLRKQLLESSRYEWACEDSAALIDPAQYVQDPAEAWQRVRRIQYLPAAEQARARRLAAWRERQAMRLNRPRQWILSDRALMAIAGKGPVNRDELAGCADLPAGVVRKRGEALLEQVALADRELASGKLQIEQKQRLPSKEPALVNQLVGIVRAHSERLNIPAEILASRREISAIARGKRDGRVLSGWRLEVFGNELLTAVPATPQ